MGSKYKNGIRQLLSKYQRLVMLLAVILIMTVLQPGVFLTMGNFKSILLAISIYGIMVCGTIFPILLGGIDLSVGAIAATSGACVVLTTIKFEYSSGGVVLGIFLGVGVGLVIGLIHGLIVAYFQVPAFLVTLATQNIIYGVAQLLTNTKVISCMKPELFTAIGGGRLLGVPIPVYFLLLLLLVSYVLLNKTVFGRKVYAVGGNGEAADLSGISSKQIRCICYALSGVTAAAAGIILASMNQQAIAKAAQGYENDVLTAIVVGGTSLMGGEGTIQGAAWGALLVGIINNGLRLMGVPATYHSVVKCVIIVAAVAIDAYGRHKKSGLQKHRLFKRKA